MATHPYMPSCVPVMLRAHAGSNLKAGRQGQVSILAGHSHLCNQSQSGMMCFVPVHPCKNPPVRTGVYTLRHD